MSASARFSASAALSLLKAFRWRLFLVVLLVVGLLHGAEALSVTLPVAGKIIAIAYDHSPLSTTNDRAPLYAAVYLGRVSNTGIIKCEVANTMTCGQAASLLSFTETAGLDASSNEAGFGYYNEVSGWVYFTAAPGTSNQAVIISANAAFSGGVDAAMTARVTDSTFDPGNAGPVTAGCVHSTMKIAYLSSRTGVIYGSYYGTSDGSHTTSKISLGNPNAPPNLAATGMAFRPDTVGSANGRLFVSYAGANTVRSYTVTGPVASTTPQPQVSAPTVVGALTPASAALGYSPVNGRLYVWDGTLIYPYDAATPTSAPGTTWGSGSSTIRSSWIDESTAASGGGIYAVACGSDATTVSVHSAIVTGGTTIGTKTTVGLTPGATTPRVCSSINVARVVPSGSEFVVIVGMSSTTAANPVIQSLNVATLTDFIGPTESVTVTPTASSSPSTTVSRAASVSPSPSVSWSPTVSRTQTPSNLGTMSLSPVATSSPSATASESASVSPSRSIAGTSSVSPSTSAAPTQSPSSSVAATSSPSLSSTVSTSPSVSESASQTVTASFSSTSSISASSSGTSSQSPSTSISLSATGSASETATATRSASVSQSSTQSASISSSASSTVSGTSSATLSFSSSASASGSESGSASSSASVTSSVSASASETRSVSLSSSATASASVTPSSSLSLTATPSASVSASGSSSATLSSSVSQTATVTSTRSESASATLSPSESASLSLTASVTASPSTSSSASRSVTLSVSETATASSSSSASRSPSASSSPSASATATASESVSSSSSPSVTASVSLSSTVSGSTSASETASITITPSPVTSTSSSPSESASISETSTVSSSKTASASVSSTASETATATVSSTASKSPSTSITASESPSVTVSSSLSATMSPSASTSSSASLTASASESPSESLSVTSTGSATVSSSQTATSSSSTSATVSPSESISETASSSASVTVSSSETATPSITVTSSHSPSESVSASVSLSPSVSVTSSSSVTASVSITQSASETVSVTLSPTESVSVSSSPSETQSVSVSISGTITSSTSVSPSASISSSVSATVTSCVSVTTTGSVSASVSNTASLSLSPSTSASLTASPSTSISSTATPSSSVSLTVSPSSSVSITASPSTSVSSSVSPSSSVTSSASLSLSPSLTVTATLSPSSSVSSTASISPSVSSSVSPTLSASVWGSSTVSPSSSVTASGTVTSSITASATLTVSASSSASVTTTASSSTSATATTSSSVSLTVSPSSSVSLTASPSTSVSSSVSPSSSVTSSASLSLSPSSTVTATVSPSTSISASSSVTATVSSSTSPSASVSVTTTVSSSISATTTRSVSITSTVSSSPTASSSVTATTTRSSSVSPSVTASTSVSPSVSASTTASSSVTASVTVSPSRTSSVSATPLPSLTKAPLLIPSQLAFPCPVIEIPAARLTSLAPAGNSSSGGLLPTASPSSGPLFEETRQLVLDVTFTIRGLPFTAFQNRSATAALPCLATLVAAAAADFSGASANASVWLYSVYQGDINGEGFALFGAQTILREAYALSASMCEKAGLSATTVVAAAAAETGVSWNSSDTTIVTGSGTSAADVTLASLLDSSLTNGIPGLERTPPAGVSVPISVSQGLVALAESVQEVGTARIEGSMSFRVLIDTGFPMEYLCGEPVIVKQQQNRAATLLTKQRGNELFAVPSSAASLWNNLMANGPPPPVLASEDGGALNVSSLSRVAYDMWTEGELIVCNGSLPQMHSNATSLASVSAASSAAFRTALYGAAGCSVLQSAGRALGWGGRSNLASNSSSARRRLQSSNSTANVTTVDLGGPGIVILGMSSVAFAAADPRAFPGVSFGSAPEVSIKSTAVTLSPAYAFWASWVSVFTPGVTAGGFWLLLVGLFGLLYALALVRYYSALSYQRAQRRESLVRTLCAERALQLQRWDALEFVSLAPSSSLGDWSVLKRRRVAVVGAIDALHSALVEPSFSHAFAPSTYALVANEQGRVIAERVATLALNERVATLVSTAEGCVLNRAADVIDEKQWRAAEARRLEQEAREREEEARAERVRAEIAAVEAAAIEALGAETLKRRNAAAVVLREMNMPEVPRSQSSSAGTRTPPSGAISQPAGTSATAPSHPMSLHAAVVAAAELASRDAATPEAAEVPVPTAVEPPPDDCITAASASLIASLHSTQPQTFTKLLEIFIKTAGAVIGDHETRNQGAFANAVASFHASRAAEIESDTMLRLAARREIRRRTLLSKVRDDKRDEDLVAEAHGPVGAGGKLTKKSRKLKAEDEAEEDEETARMRKEKEAEEAAREAEARALRQAQRAKEQAEDEADAAADLEATKALLAERMAALNRTGLTPTDLLLAVIEACVAEAEAFLANQAKNKAPLPQAALLMMRRRAIERAAARRKAEEAGVVVDPTEELPVWSTKPRTVSQGAKATLLALMAHGIQCKEAVAQWRLGGHASVASGAAAGASPSDETAVADATASFAASLKHFPLNLRFCMAPPKADAEEAHRLRSILAEDQAEDRAREEWDCLRINERAAWWGALAESGEPSLGETKPEADPSLALFTASEARDYLLHNEAAWEQGLGETGEQILLPLACTPVVAIRSSLRCLALLTLQEAAKASSSLLLRSLTQFDTQTTSLFTQAKHIAEAAAKQRLPVKVPTPSSPSSAAPSSVGSSRLDTHRWLWQQLDDSDDGSSMREVLDDDDKEDVVRAMAQLDVRSAIAGGGSGTALWPLWAMGLLKHSPFPLLPKCSPECCRATRVSREPDFALAAEGKRQSKGFVVRPLQRHKLATKSMRIGASGADYKDIVRDLEAPPDHWSLWPGLPYSRALPSAPRYLAEYDRFIKDVFGWHTAEESARIRQKAAKWPSSSPTPKRIPSVVGSFSLSVGKSARLNKQAGSSDPAEGGGSLLLTTLNVLRAHKEAQERAAEEQRELEEQEARARQVQAKLAEEEAARAAEEAQRRDWWSWLKRKGPLRTASASMSKQQLQPRSGSSRDVAVVVASPLASLPPGLISALPLVSPDTLFDKRGEPAPGAFSKSNPLLLAAGAASKAKAAATVSAVGSENPFAEAVKALPSMNPNLDRLPSTRVAPLLTGGKAERRPKVVAAAATAKNNFAPSTAVSSRRIVPIPSKKFRQDAPAAAIAAEADTLESGDTVKPSLTTTIGAINLQLSMELTTMGQGISAAVTAAAKGAATIAAAESKHSTQASPPVPRVRSKPRGAVPSASVSGEAKEEAKKPPSALGQEIAAALDLGGLGNAVTALSTLTLRFASESEVNAAANSPLRTQSPSRGPPASTAVAPTSSTLLSVPSPPAPRVRSKPRGAVQAAPSDSKGEAKPISALGQEIAAALDLGGLDKAVSAVTSSLRSASESEANAASSSSKSAGSGLRTKSPTQGGAGAGTPRVINPISSTNPLANVLLRKPLEAQPRSPAQALRPAARGSIFSTLFAGVTGRSRSQTTREASAATTVVASPLQAASLALRALEAKPSVAQPAIHSSERSSATVVKQVIPHRPFAPNARKGRLSMLQGDREDEDSRVGFSSARTGVGTSRPAAPGFGPSTGLAADAAAAVAGLDDLTLSFGAGTATPVSAPAPAATAGGQSRLARSIRDATSGLDDLVDNNKW